MRTLLFLLAAVTLAGPALAQDRETVRQWVHDQKTERPIYYYSVGTNCCDEADGKQRVVEYLGSDNYKTYDDDGTPLYFNQDALGEKNDSPFFAWFIYIVNHRVICARRPQTGG